MNNNRDIAEQQPAQQELQISPFFFFLVSGDKESLRATGLVSQCQMNNILFHECKSARALQ